MRISVIGCGYLELSTPPAWRSSDVASSVSTCSSPRSPLCRGAAPFFEPGLPELLEVGLASGRPHEVGALVAEKRVLDGRNCLDPDRWRGAGWTYRALGRP